jgi:hypothetical protein
MYLNILNNLDAAFQFLHELLFHDDASLVHAMECYTQPTLPNFKGNSENMLLFLFHGTEFRVVFSPATRFGTEFRDFLFRGTAGIPSEITLCSVYSVFRGIIFLSEIPNPTYGGDLYLRIKTTKIVA